MRPSASPRTALVTFNDTSISAKYRTAVGADQLGHRCDHHREGRPRSPI